MPYRPTEWAHKIRFEPEGAKIEILAAYAAAEGVATRAAACLGVSHGSLLRFVRLLGLREAVARVRARVQELATTKEGP